MSRLFFGAGKGFKTKTGFRVPTVPRSMNTEFIRPKFGAGVSQFMRKTSATYWTPWPFGAEGSGGSTYPVTVVEPATIIDTVSCILTAVAALTESASAQATASAVAVMLASLTEAAAALSAQAAGTVTLAFVTEPASAADTVSMVLTMLAGLSESSTAEDAVSAIATLLADVIEAAAAIDDCNFASGSVYPVDVIESATLVDLTDCLILAIKLYNGLKLVHHMTPGDVDVRVKAGVDIIGVPTGAATDDAAGAVRIKVDGTVYSLKQVE